jgi:phosphatidylglycerol lysyltransferase
MAPDTSARGWLHRLAPVVGVILFGVALYVLHRELELIRLHEVIDQFRRIPTRILLTAIAATAFSYLVLTQYDTVALRYVGARVGLKRSSLAAYLGFAFAQNVGFTLFSGAPVRFRFYSVWGLSAVEIATVLAFNSITFWLGLIACAGVTFILAGGVVPTGLHLPVTALRPLGATLLLIAGAYLVACAARRAPFRFGRWQLALPSLRQALAQVGLAGLDWISATLVLYVLLPREAAGHFAHFMAVFLLAQLAGLVSQVPGGLGIFETVMVILLPPTVPQSVALGSLLAFRLIYYLLPLAVAVLLLLAFELHQRREELGKAVKVVGSWLPALEPHLLAVLTFVGGAVMLVFGSVPAAPARLHWLADFVPLAILELSHFLGSLVGIGLIVLAWGLRRRLEIAYYLASGLLAVSVVLSLLRGLHVEAAIFLALMLAALLPARRAFYRRAALLSDPFSGAWLAALAMVVIGAVWIGFFAYRHVDYTSELWWQFELHGNASRFLRSALAVAIGLVSLGIVRLLGPSVPREAAAGEETRALVRAVVASSPAASAHLALLGDKRFLIADSNAAFVMYAVQQRSWVAMGDPVGPSDEHAELIWRFNALADRHGGWTVFYEVGEENLPIYLDLGLTVLKIGEEARVDLARFSLDGREHKGLRHSLNKLEREGCSFAIMPREAVPALLPELRSVSDAWLASKSTREKRFSLGRFDEAYLREQPVVVVHQEERVVAFANLWRGATGGELSIDLMRFQNDAPAGVMDFLFINLMLWGKEEGYSEFGLGMAPFAGLRSGPFAPLWNRLAVLLYRYGEHFYNFKGLRQYKDKFDPQWRPRYLVCPGGSAVPGVLADLAALVSGGLAGVLRR